MNKSSLSLLQTSRPIFWFGPIFVYIAGIIASHSPWNFLAFWGFFFVTFPMGLIVYGLNDIADQKSDASNPRKGGVEGAVVKKSQVGFLYLAIIITITISVIPFIVFNHLFSLIPIGFILFYAYAYSFEPLRFKSRPILDSVSSAFWLYSMFLLAFSLNVQSFVGLFLVPRVVVSLVLGAFAAHALTTLFDYEVDKKVGDTTIGGLLTKRGIALLCLGVYCLILFLLEPINTAFLVYLLLSILLCAVIIVIPAKKIVYYSTWTIVLSFPVACLYTLLFEFQYLQFLLSL